MNEAEYKKAKEFFESLNVVFNIWKIKGPVKIRVRNMRIERMLREQPLPLFKIGRGHENN